MKALSELIRPNIQSLIPYSSAREEFEGQARVWMDANESPFDSSLNRYPDPFQRELKDAIANIHGIESRQIFLGNGSDEAIDLLIRAFCEPKEDAILYLPPTYGMYQVAADINHVQSIQIPLDANFQPDLEAIQTHLQNPKLKLIFLCSPNNPTGNLMEKKRIEWIIENFEGLVVLDEAYAEFAEDGSMLDQFLASPNLIILRTFSKAWGLAGARLGAALASPNIIQILNRIKPPYNVNQLTQSIALKRIQEIGQMKANVQQILQERSRLTQALQQMKGVNRVYPSDANFVLFEVEDARAVYEKLMQQGIIIRNRSKLIPHALRLSVGTAAENDLFLETLQQILHPSPQIGKVPKWEVLESQLKPPTRTAIIQRNTQETQIRVELDVDGSGKGSIQTGLGFFDHMLEQLQKHGKMDLSVEVAGDWEIDEHHSIEDTALALGAAFYEALGDRKGIQRYGFLLPMDDCLAQVAIDFGGRPWLVWEADFEREKIGEMPSEMFFHFFKSFSDTAKCNLNIQAEGKNEHHKIEAIFKAFARAIRMAVKQTGETDVPSTKGILA